MRSSWPECARVSLVDLRHDRAGLADDAAGCDRLDLVHLGKVQHDAAGQRHGLAIIAGAGAARRHRHVVGEGHLQDADDLGLVLRRRHEIGGHVVELRLQHRRIPEEVAALLLDQRRIVLELDAGEIRA